MRLLVAGEIGPGSLVRSLEPGLSALAEVTLVDPSGISGLVSRSDPLSRVRRKLAARVTDARFLDAVSDHQPDVVLVVKGRGLSPSSIEQVRARGVVTAVYHPDNPWWRATDHGGLARLAAADLALVWSQRLADRLAGIARRVGVVPFGYDERWYGGAPGGDRHGVVFLGTWSPRRERFLLALAGLDVVVRGLGWRPDLPFDVAPPTYEGDGGRLLARAAVGVNLLHPQCAGAHNMRTREIAASGAFQVTEPGTDGTPLRPDDGCAWFQTPSELRVAVEVALADPVAAAMQSTRAQALVGAETYRARGRQLATLLAEALT